MSNKRLAIMLLLLGLVTWGCAVMVLRGAAAQMSVMNKLPGVLSEEHGLYKDYGLTPAQLETMIDESVWLQSEWLWLAVLLLVLLGLLEVLSGIVYFVRSRKKESE